MQDILLSAKTMDNEYIFMKDEEEEEDSVLLSKAHDRDSHADNYMSATAGQDAPLSLQQLPLELLRHVYSFMDISTMGIMAQVQRQLPSCTGSKESAAASVGALSDLACSNEIWGPLVEKRFLISPKVKRPKTYGGKDWKDAYCSMHKCQRLPKCRFTARKAVFAKTIHHPSNSDSKESITSIRRKHFHSNNNNDNTNSDDDDHSARSVLLPPCPLTSLMCPKKRPPQLVSMWVLLNHTENCRTRILPNHTPPQVPAATTTPPTRRYIDMWVCLQNIQSNGVSIKVDSLKAQLRFLSMGGSVYKVPCLQHQASLPCGNCTWIGPRVMCQHTAGEKATLRSSSAKSCRAKRPCVGNPNDHDHDGNDVAVVDMSDGVTLKPLEFCVVSIPFDCGSDDVYETDVLARTVSLQVPFSIMDDSTKKNKSLLVGSDDTCNLQSYKLPSPQQQQVATAWFVPESDVWDQYCELPGGCLTLSDRERRVHL